MDGFKYIGIITLKSLRDAILDFKITSTDAIAIHPHEFDELAVEYRETYKESIQLPFIFLGVYIYLSQDSKFPLNRIKIEKNVVKPQQRKKQEELYPPFDVIYRCGWCGNIVNADGTLLDANTRVEYIRIVKKFDKQIEHIAVNGECCKDEH